MMERAKAVHGGVEQRGGEIRGLTDNTRRGEGGQDWLSDSVWSNSEAVVKRSDSSPGKGTVDQRLRLLSGPMEEAGN
jgi:hypothetical protein